MRAAGGLLHTEVLPAAAKSRNFAARPPS